MRWPSVGQRVAVPADERASSQKKLRKVVELNRIELSTS
jgi:hypothetical protein